MSREKAYFALKIKSIVKIQSSWLGLKQRRKYEDLKRASIVIQCLVRRHQAKNYLEQLRQEKRDSQHKAAILIQKTWKMSREKSYFNAKIKSIVKIQASWRGLQQKRKYENLKRASIILQTFTRQHIAMDMLKRLKKEKNAALVIQKNWKRYIAGKRKHHMINSVVLIQKTWRLYCHKEKLRCEGFAATILQANWRGMKERRNYQHLRLSVIRVQCLVRRHLAQVKLQAMKQQKQYRDEVESLLSLKRKISAAITIQKYWRGHVVRQGFQLAANQPIVSVSWFTSRIDSQYKVGIIVTLQ